MAGDWTIIDFVDPNPPIWRPLKGPPPTRGRFEGCWTLLLVVVWLALLLIDVWLTLLLLMGLSMRVKATRVEAIGAPPFDWVMTL